MFPGWIGICCGMLGTLITDGVPLLGSSALFHLLLKGNKGGVSFMVLIWGVFSLVLPLR